MVWEWFGCVRVLPCLFPPWSLVWSTTSSSAISSCCSGSMAFVMRLSTGLKSIEVLCVCVWVVSLSPLSHLASQLRLGVAVKVCLCLCPRFSSSVYCSSQRFSSPRFFATKGGVELTGGLDASWRSLSLAGVSTLPAVEVRASAVCC